MCFRHSFFSCTQKITVERAQQSPQNHGNRIFPIVFWAYRVRFLERARKSLVRRKTVLKRNVKNRTLRVADFLQRKRKPSVAQIIEFFFSDLHPKKVTVLKMTGVELVTLFNLRFSCNTAYSFYCSRLSDRIYFSVPERLQILSFQIS